MKFTFITLVLLLAIPHFLQGQESSIKESMGQYKTKESKFSSFYQYSTRAFKGEKVEFKFPETLDVTLQLLGISYQLDESTKIGLATSHIKNDIVLQGGKPDPRAPYLAPYSDSTSGISDTYLGVYKTYQLDTYSEIELAFQVSLPTGAYDLKDSRGQYYSYAAQLGSGTIDAVPYFKHTLKSDKHKLAYTIQGKFRNGTNSVGYRLGDEFRTTIAYDYKLFRGLTLALSAYHKQWGDVAGADLVSAYNAKVGASIKKPTGGHGGPTHSGGGHRGAPKSAKPKLDKFSTKGSRFSTLVGLKTGIFVSKDLGTIFEFSKPFYNTQNGDLEGLSMGWVAKATFVAKF